jgi:hypothetical protein
MKFELEPYYRNLSDEELVSDLKRVADQLGVQELKRRDYTVHGKYSPSTYIKRFGSWKEALKKAGLKTARNWGTELEEYFENIQEVWLKLGRQPRYEDMTIPFSKLSGSAYAHKFGTWRSALEKFIVWANEELEPQYKKNIITQKVRGRTPKSINYRLRALVLMRDGAQCRLCGATPQDGAKLQVDHIKPWSKGGETVMENLQILCEQCNLGKSNIENKEHG